MRKTVSLVCILILLQSISSRLQGQPIEGKLHFNLFDKTGKIIFSPPANDTANWYSNNIEDSSGSYVIKLYEVLPENIYNPYPKIHVGRQPYVEVKTYGEATYCLTIVLLKPIRDSMEIVFNSVGNDRYGLDIHFTPGRYHINAKTLMGDKNKYQMKKKYSGIDITPSKWEKIKIKKSKKNWFCR